MADFFGNLAIGLEGLTLHLALVEAAQDGLITSAELVEAVLETDRIAAEKGREAAITYMESVLAAAEAGEKAAVGLGKFEEAMQRNKDTSMAMLFDMEHSEQIYADAQVATEKYWDAQDYAAHMTANLNRELKEQGLALGLISGRMPVYTTPSDIGQTSMEALVWAAQKEKLEEDALAAEAARLKEEEDLNKKTATAVQRAWEDSIAAQQAAWDDLRSAVTAALKPTSVTAADMEAAGAGTYVEKWDEAARQLDAIAARGFAELDAHPDWAGMLKIPPEVLAGGSEALKAWARQTSQDVRDLARPDLLNMDQAVADVRAYMARQKAIELTIDLVAAAAGPGVSREDVAAMYGMAPSEMPIMPVIGEDQKAALMETLTAEGGIPVPVQFTDTEGGSLQDAGASMGAVIIAGIGFAVTQMSVADEAAAAITKDTEKKEKALKDSGGGLWDRVSLGIEKRMQDKEYAKMFARHMAPYVADVLQQRGVFDH